MLPQIGNEEIRSLAKGDLALDENGNVDLAKTISNLRATAAWAEQRADNARYYADNIGGYGGSFFEWEDARDDSREWRSRAANALTLATRLEKLHGR